MGSVACPKATLGDLAARHGGRVVGSNAEVSSLAPVIGAGQGQLAPWVHPRYSVEARAALARGAALLVDERRADQLGDLGGGRVWVHPFPSWVLAELLLSTEPMPPPVLGPGCEVGEGAVLLPGVRLGARVRIGAGAVLGSPGFSTAAGPAGARRAMPHRGGVVIEDDVEIGPLCTVAAGTLAPTRIGARTRLDAQVHVAHNCTLGPDTLVAAQTGLAGSVRVGRGVLLGGQVGIADHVVIGDFARVAAKSGVISDVPTSGVVAGYPAVARPKWLRGLAHMYRAARMRGVVDPRSHEEPS